MAGLGNANGLGNLKPAVVEPKRGHEMEGHVRLKDRRITPPERDCALAPVGRVADADGVAAAAVFLKPGLVERFVKSVGDVLGLVAGFCLFEPGVDGI